MTHYINPLYLWKKAQKIFYTEIAALKSPRDVSLCMSLGLFIAFSPFIGLHNMMALGCAWLLNLSAPLLLLISHINNPWTMIPIYYSDYFVGKWFVHLFGLNIIGWTPCWLEGCGSYVKALLGLEICLITFLLGGILIAIAVGLFSYLGTHWYMTKYKQQKNYENYCDK